MILLFALRSNSSNLEAVQLLPLHYLSGQVYVFLLIQLCVVEDYVLLISLSIWTNVAFLFAVLVPFKLFYSMNRVHPLFFAPFQLLTFCVVAPFFAFHTTTAQELMLFHFDLLIANYFTTENRHLQSRHAFIGSY